MVVFSCREMASLVHRLRPRTGPKPVYTSEDDMDEDFVLEETVGSKEEVCLCVIVKHLPGFDLQ